MQGKHYSNNKTGVALLIRRRGHCELLWAVIPPLQVVLSSACSVASLGRCPSHYLPGHPCLRQDVLAAHLFGWGIPSTQQAGHVTVHSASSVKSPCRAQRGMTLPNKKSRFVILKQALTQIPPLGKIFCWAEAPIKIARMTLTIKLDRNWSSFQLANSAPPLSVTDSAIAPSARMLIIFRSILLTFVG